MKSMQWVGGVSDFGLIRNPADISLFTMLATACRTRREEAAEMRMSSRYTSVWTCRPRTADRTRAFTNL